MRDRFSGSMVTVAVAAAAVSAAISVNVTGTSAQAPAASGTALRTPWGEPDLQGIWTDEFDTPLQRPAKYANQEFFTAAQREELDKQRGVLYGSDPRQGRGTAVDVGGAYNTAFLTIKHAGARTSLVVDPPNGRIPPLTPEAQQAAAADREFRLALLQSTEACKNQEPVCAEASTIRRPRLDSQTPLLATTRVTSCASIAAMVRRMTGWQTAACTAGCPSLAASSAAAFAESCRHPAASRCSTT
jgi:hypothetical protein